VAGADKGLKVFVSYARADGSAFAEQLIDGLEIGGFEPFLDRHDIAAGEDWQTRLEGLIAAADTLVYVISPASIASERCGWEVEKARQLSKRLLPVVLLDVPDEAIPSELARLNFIHFNRGASFPRALKDLVAALKTDEVWIREHTRLAEAAARWAARSRDPSLLLRGPELADAQRWLDAARPDSPPPTDLHRELIRESAAFANQAMAEERQRLAEREQALRQLSRRTTLGLTASGILAAAASGLAFWGVNAEARFNAERKRAEEAVNEALQRAIARETTRKDLTGQFTAYATARGAVAMDGEETSPFTKAVLDNLSERDISLFDAVIWAQDEVLAATNGRQRPFVSTDLNGDVYLGHQSPTRKLTALVVGVSEYANLRPLQTPAADAQAWATFLDSAGFEVTLLQNPTGRDILAALGIVATAAPARFDAGHQQATVTLAGLAPVAPEEQAQPAEPDSLRFFVYTGNGANIDGDDFIAPSDVEISSAESFRLTAISMSSIASHLRATALASAVILDTNFPEAFEPQTTR
jgi:hypothetical protein